MGDIKSVFLFSLDVFMKKIEESREWEKMGNVEGEKM